MFQRYSRRHQGWNLMFYQFFAGLNSAGMSKIPPATPGLLLRSIVTIQHKKKCIFFHFFLDTVFGQNLKFWLRFQSCFYWGYEASNIAVNRFNTYWQQHVISKKFKFNQAQSEAKKSGFKTCVILPLSIRQFKEIWWR